MRTVAPRVTRPVVGSSSPASSFTSDRLARPVHADERHTVARPQAPGQLVQHLALAERQRHVDRVEHLVAEARGGEAQQLRAVARLWLVGDQRVGGVDAELRLASCAPAGRVAATRAPCASAVGGGSRARSPDGRARRARARTRRSHPRTGAQCRRTPPTSPCTPRRGTSGRGSPRASSRGVRRGGARANPRLRVEMVGRLVQQQQLGSVEQQTRQRDAPALASRQAPNRRVHPVRRSSDSVTPPISPSSTSRNALSPAHSCSARSPTRISRIVRRSSSSSRCPSSATSTSPVRVSAPASGASTPAISRSSVDLPPPFCPTTPMRSPADDA